MPSLSSDLPRTLIIQLARLGDLLQSIPVLFSLCEKYSDQSFDLLCPQPLVGLGKLFPGIEQTIPWNGEDWHVLAKSWDGTLPQGNSQVVEYFSRFPAIPYSVAYNLNNHPRSILAAHLLSERVIGSGDLGPLNPSRPPWVEYLRQVACERSLNRIHLSDAFCGICGVQPPVALPHLEPAVFELPTDIVLTINDSSLVKIGIVLGAGDVDRRVPVSTWKRLIEGCTEQFPNCVCMLIGGAGEREIAMAIEDQLSSIYLSRILNCVGRTSLPELAHVFHRCQWVVGSDTGPLHLGVACGARVIGWYFSRARVHETGPYGVGHYVWQHQGTVHFENTGKSDVNHRPELPCSWPVVETIELMQGHDSWKGLSDWKLWMSQRDDWGTFFVNGESPDAQVSQRKKVWEQLASLSLKRSSVHTQHIISTGCLV